MFQICVLFFPHPFRIASNNYTYSKMTPTMKEGEMQLKITRALRSSAMRNRNCMSLPKSEGVILEYV